MKIGTVKEIKDFEYRVGMTPDNAKQYIDSGHSVYVQAGAGEGSGFCDDEYKKAGVTVTDNAAKIWETCDMIIKVKEPLPPEYKMIREGQILYTYLHLASSLSLTETLLKAKCIGVAYETVVVGMTTPLLKPMSIIAGRLSVLEGAKYLEKPMGGKGVLLSGVPGTARAHVVILGGGVVGSSACDTAVGMGARVTVIDIDQRKLEILDDKYYNRITTLMCSPENIELSLPSADLVIGAILIPGAGAEKLIKRQHLQKMQKGSVIVDVAVDQGGCAETTRITYHNDPVYEVDGILHYCVGNMPGAVPATSTRALTNATIKYGLMIANEGINEAQKKHAALASGVNLWRGMCTHEAVAKSLGLAYTPLSVAAEAN
ncbi:MAG: alanine dehydrogenase [Defluviitaleaceae bacterium]|nr:alanine dehydrogenase [Defluviitaleaceae bacterium]